MFTKPANEIEFADIEDFCCEFGKEVRVDISKKLLCGKLTDPWTISPQFSQK